MNETIIELKTGIKKAEKNLGIYNQKIQRASNILADTLIHATVKLEWAKLSVAIAKKSRTVEELSRLKNQLYILQKSIID